MPPNGAYPSFAYNELPALWPDRGNRRAEPDARAFDDLEVVRRIGTKLRFARAATVFSAGDPADFSYEVVSGALRLCKHLADGRRQIAQFLLTGDFFATLNGPEHSFSAEAINDTVLVRYPQAQIEQMADQRIAVRKWLAALLGRRIHDVENHLLLLGCKSAREKVASFFLTLAGHANCDDGTAFDVPMSRQDIADFLGLSVETVCRAISAMKRDRVIDKPHPREFAIKDCEALARFAEGGEYSSAV